MTELYGVRVRWGNMFVEEVVSAASWEEAEAMATMMNGEVTGKLGGLSVDRYDHDTDEDGWY